MQVVSVLTLQAPVAREMVSVPCVASHVEVMLVGRAEQPVEASQSASESCVES